MKITYLANIRLPTEKAHGIQITKMCESFASLGHEVTLVVPDRVSAITTDPFEYYGLRRNFIINRLPTYNPKVITAAFFRLQSFLFFILSFWFMLPRKEDLVYSRETGPLLLLALLGRRFIWEVHTAKGPVLARYLARRAVSVVAITAGLKDALVSVGVPAQRILVAHDAIDPDDFPTGEDKGELRKSLGLPPSRKIVGYVGKYRTAGLAKGVSGSKGVDEFIEAFAKAREDAPDALLLLVGLNPDELSLVTDIAVRFGIPKDARVIVGHVAHRQALAYMRAADVLVMNYPALEHYAHFMSPLKLFEYMASGAAIVSTDLPSVREVLDESCAVLVPPDDGPALAGGISVLLGDAERVSVLAHAASLRVRERHTWLSRTEGILLPLVSAEEHRHNQ